MGKAFSLANYIVDAPETGVQQEKLEYIPFSQIIPDPQNGYSMDGIEDLARNIGLVGLRDPLRVYSVEDGMFMISSGHRRHAAIGLVMESDPEAFAQGVPCIVDRSDDSPAVREFKLLMANMDNRKMSDADLSQQLLRIQDVCRRLEDEGFRLKGRARDWVAEMAGVSRTKVGTLQAIRNNLDPELLEAFDKGKLNTAVANELQKLPREFQLRIVKASGKAPGHELTMSRVKQAREWYEEGERWETCLTCPDGQACKRGDTFLRHDIEEPSRACFGKTCCLDCDQGTRRDWPCERRCSKAEAVRKKERDEGKAAEERRFEKLLNKVKAETTESAKRIRKALDAAGVEDNVKLKFSEYYYFGSFTAKEIRDMADGVFPDGFNTRENPLQLKRLVYDLPRLCQVLQCSADYIIGRTDELNPDAGKTEAWRYPERGQLPNAGDQVIALVKYSPEANWVSEILDYTEQGFAQYGFAVPENVLIRWAPYVPPEESVPNLGTTEERED